MEAIYTTQELLVLRKLTRAIGEVIGGQMREYLITLTPLFRQRAVFGERIQGTTKEPVKGADQAFEELQKLYDTIGTKQPFNLPTELKSPLEQMTASLELTPWEYAHVVKLDGQAKTITATCPFKSIVSYAGYSPHRLKELLTHRNRDFGELQHCVLHYLAMHVVISKQPGLARLLDSLRFPLGSGRLPGLGELPITFITSAVSTSLPPDELIIQSTELSGKNVFEEIVNAADIERLADPLKERLLALVKS